jgi:hypothetical protein
MHSPRIPHLDAINRLLRYLKGTPEKRIWMKNNNSNIIILMQIGSESLIENQQPVSAHL